MKFNYSIILFLFIICRSCKHDVAGCTDPEATKKSLHANLNDGSCKYSPFFLNPSFETCCDWPTYSGNGFSPAAFITNQGDGFMPTDGKYYLKCLPYVNYSMGTLTKQFCEANKHTKGFYFDYSYTYVAGPDSIVKATIDIDYFNTAFIGSNWSKVIYETPNTFSGFPKLTIQKRDEYMDLPYSEIEGVIHIKTSVSKGTFTFQIDNILEVPR